MIKLTKDDYVIFSFIFFTLAVSLILKLFPDKKKEKFEIFPGYNLLEKPKPGSGLIGYECSRKKGCDNCLSEQIYSSVIKTKKKKIPPKKNVIKCFEDSDCTKINDDSYCLFNPGQNPPFNCSNGY